MNEELVNESLCMLPLSNSDHKSMDPYDHESLKDGTKRSKTVKPVFGIYAKVIAEQKACFTIKVVVRAILCDLTDFEKVMIIGYRTQGRVISETAAFLKYSRSAIVSEYNRVKNECDLQFRRANYGVLRLINVKGERRLRRPINFVTLTTP
ncbi:hypothetical protein TNCV_1007411 [Trichonephila clavipes]|nr:hypothetical protein TNCV_1007411 [Trichonephila clavipes]